MLKNYYWFWEKAVPDKFCDLIIDNCDWKHSEPGTVYDNNQGKFVENNELRETEVIWSQQLSVVWCILESYIKAANESAKWNFKCSFMENVQLGRYGMGGHYDWHKDTGILTDEQTHRKLSASLLLNNVEDFEGGKFEFRDLNEDQQPNLVKGSLIVFPSFLEHRVTPVTKGQRVSAVTWVHGPSFV